MTTQSGKSAVEVDRVDKVSAAILGCHCEHTRCFTQSGDVLSCSDCGGEIECIHARGGAIRGDMIYGVIYAPQVW
jgi:hypothetical protein